MATLYITECARVIVDTANQYVNVPAMPPVTEQSVQIGGASVQSNPFQSNTRFAVLSTDIACSIAFGRNPTAAVTAQRLAPNETRRYGVQPGQVVAVISNS